MAIPKPVGIVWDLVCWALAGEPWPKVSPDDLRPLAGEYGRRVGQLNTLAAEVRTAGIAMLSAAPCAAGMGVYQQAQVLADSLEAAGRVATTQQTSLDTSAEEIDETEWHI